MIFGRWNFFQVTTQRWACSKCLCPAYAWRCHSFCPSSWLSIHYFWHELVQEETYHKVNVICAADKLAGTAWPVDLHHFTARHVVQEEVRPPFALTEIRQVASPPSLAHRHEQQSIYELVTHACLTEPMGLPGGASTVMYMEQQSPSAHQQQPAQHLNSLFTRITSCGCGNVNNVSVTANS